ncbi:MAG: hypothetical protein ACYDHX_02120 [Methanothrix sp.]
MKWYNDIIKLSLIIFFIFIFGSFAINRLEWDWWPEVLLILAEAALSVVIVLKIIEVSSRRERERRWESVKFVVYSQILDKLRLIGYHVCRTTFMFRLESQDIDRERIEIYGMYRDEAISVLRSLASSIRDNHKFLFDIINISMDHLSKNDPMEQPVQDLIECFDNIRHEINEYKIALVPRVLALSDDVEVNLALLRFEDVYNILFYREDFLKRYNSLRFREDNRRKYIGLGDNFVDPAFMSLADLLNSTADLYELIQRKSVTIPERSLIEEGVQTIENWVKEIPKKIKYWWLPPQFWQDNC